MAFVNGNCFWYGYLIERISPEQPIFSKAVSIRQNRSSRHTPTCTKDVPIKIKTLPRFLPKICTFLHGIIKATEIIPRLLSISLSIGFVKVKNGYRESQKHTRGYTDNFYVLLTKEEKSYIYVVTALDAFKNESKAKR